MFFLFQKKEFRTSLLRKGKPFSSSPFEKGGLRGILKKRTNPPLPSFVKGGSLNGICFLPPPFSKGGCGGILNLNDHNLQEERINVIT
jgi:hypothetical protein